MPSKDRLIDQLPPANRKDEMFVLGLGLPRTGSKSLKTALDILGINTYHSITAVSDDHCQYWYEALAAKYNGDGQLYDVRDFEKLLAKYQGIDDAPATLFADEHLANYPNARIILTSRDADSWFDSFNNTFIHMFRSRWWNVLPYLLPADPLKWLNYACAVLTIHSGHGCTKEIQPELWTRENYRRYWKEYYAHMDAVLPSDTSRVLRYRVQEGWEPLCNFLGKEVPNEPFPHLNSRKDSRVGVAERLSTYKAMAGSNVMKMMAAPAIASMAIGAAFWLKDHKM